LNAYSFVVNFCLLSIGFVFDLWTTKTFTADLGMSYEQSPLIKSLVPKIGFPRYVLLVELPLSILLAYLDSFFSLIIRLSLSLFLLRCLGATNNLRVISTYRMVGIDRFLEERRFLSARYFECNLIEKISHRSIHIASAVALGVGLILSQSVLVRSLILGLALFNLIKSIF
jgi:hypothetical protein